MLNFYVSKRWSTSLHDNRMETSKQNEDIIKAAHTSRSSRCTHHITSSNAPSVQHRVSTPKWRLRMPSNDEVIPCLILGFPGSCRFIYSKRQHVRSIQRVVVSLIFGKILLIAFSWNSSQFCRLCHAFRLQSSSMDLYESHRILMRKYNWSTIRKIECLFIQYFLAK